MSLARPQGSVAVGVTLSHPQDVSFQFTCPNRSGGWGKESHPSNFGELLLSGL